MPSSPSDTRPLLTPVAGGQASTSTSVINETYGSTVSGGQTKSKNNKDVPSQSPEANASFLSKLTVSWLSGLFRTGYRRQIQESDVYDMLPQWRAEALGPNLGRHWAQEKHRAALEGRQPSLLKALIKFGTPFYWFGQICLFISDATLKLVPIIVQWIIVFIYRSQENPENPPPVWHGYGLAFLMLFVMVFTILLNQAWVIDSLHTAISVRTALADLIFRKTTTMSSKARLYYPDGTIFNLLANDTSKVDQSLEALIFLIAVPFSTLVTVAMLWYLMGPAALLGTLILVLVNPVQAFAMSRLNGVREESAKVRDDRIRLTTEVLQGIKVIKFFTWEPSFVSKLSEIRLSELKIMSFLLYVRGFIYCTSSSLPVFASALSFVLYSALGHELKAEIVFPALALFTGLRVPLLVLPYVYSDASDAYVSMKRIERFLLTEDTLPLPAPDTNHPFAITIKKADFYWEQLPRSTSEGTSSDTGNDDTVPLLSDVQDDIIMTPLLKDITLEIPRGRLVAIVGPVGSGKSSLLQAIVGNMMKSQGTVTRGDAISFASQTAWIQNATIRDNILFDTPFEEDRYWRVVKACSLEQDMAMMPHGDMTEIGERGVNLSGGQKARLSLARSVYYNVNTIVMDDPLSAVDAHVGKRIWEDCVLRELRGKTRIIVTHQLHVLPDVDYVICMKDGHVAEEGTFQELMSNQGEFFALMSKYGGLSKGKEGDSIQPVRKLSRSKSSGLVPTVSAIGAGSIAAAVDSDDDTTVLPECEVSTEKIIPPASGQMTEEDRAYGAVSSHVYRKYFSLGGNLGWSLIVFLMFGQQATAVAMSIWLSYWTEDKLGLPKWTYINVYVGAGFAQLIIGMLGSVILVATVMKASKIMHDEAFVGVLRAPMAFFDTTPVGRILNRFSKDISTIDSTLMQSINSFLIAVSGITGMLALAAIFLPWIIVVMVPLTIAYMSLGVFYQATSRELIRVDAIMRSHLFAYFSETLTGLGTLKAYSRHGLENAIARNGRNQDRSNKGRYHVEMGMRWLAIRAQVLGYFLTFMAMVLMVWARFTINGAAVGLVLSYLARLSSEMSWAIACFSTTENNMNAAERMIEYAEDLPQEPPAQIPSHKPNPSWPSQGAVSFRNVSMRYRPELPLVLDGISFDIKAGQKIGVVGRTGAGKSSLIQALFRIAELDGGEVWMDGLDVSTIGTADLRAHIAIIPQDPVLFQGTLRYNLDPLARHTEQELWQALETSDLKSYVQGQEGGLDAVVMSQGENLSAGQRQLVCLARALLAKSKVVVLDEATASVDMATDALIQKAIRVDFADATVITIAHRLNTVADYSRVLVMDRGQVAEYDTPKTLLSNPDSAFSHMVDETGKTNAALLRSIAGC